MVWMRVYRHWFFTLLEFVPIALVLIQLFSPPVASIPLGSVEAGLAQVAIEDDDPLRDFLSSVTNITLQRRYGLRVNDIDDVYLTSAPYEDEAAGAKRQEPGESSMLRPSWFTSTLMARRLLAYSTIGTVSTVFPPILPSDSSHGVPPVASMPISLPEYIADCEGALSVSGDDSSEGNPIFLGLYISTTFRNAAAGSNISLSIDWWNHLNQTAPLYPDFPLSAVGLPRLSLIGYVAPLTVPLPKETEATLETCYLAVHPDAKAWLPGSPSSPHAGFWARMAVTQAYWIGGFGDTQQIGWINMTEWTGIRRKRSLPGIGDERGWDDVTLPGEKGC